jgi:hypothetical protein
MIVWIKTFFDDLPGMMLQKLFHKYS